MVYFIHSIFKNRFGNCIQAICIYSLGIEPIPLALLQELFYFIYLLLAGVVTGGFWTLTPILLEIELSYLCQCVSC